MRSMPVLNNNKGFTLLETLIVMVFIGVLAAVAAPSFVSMVAKARLNTAKAQVEGALQEAQQQAIRTSKPCTVAFDTIKSWVSGSCLVTGNRQLENVQIRSSAATLRYSIKGTILDINNQVITQPVTIVISTSGTLEQRCLVASAPLGLVKTGSYSGSDTVESNCLPDK